MKKRWRRELTGKEKRNVTFDLGEVRTYPKA